ncbi:MAG: Crp/Fnr family transcriptional regulator [Acidobacteria bacterium]|nr:Crp/Fnr family transcriptional regulator [Acidobacteriota bacterium]
MDTTAFAYAGMTGNALIDQLGADVSGRLLAFSRMVHLEARETLYAPGEVVRHVYFPAGCVAAACAADGGASVETALVGREGLVGLGAVLGERRARELACAVLPGDAVRVEAAALRTLFAESAVWRRLVLRFYGAHVRQISRRAVCNTRHRLCGRLATWLLALCQRADSDDLPVTQETAARQLGVRRAGVNECVADLEGRGAIAHRRGRLQVLSRGALTAAACSCHAPLSEEARWLERVAV